VAPPFDDRFDALTLDELRAFLEDAADEGLTWEAKGGDAPHAASVRKAVCGFANAIGGTLILGADRRGDPPRWHLDGMTFRDEPPVWLSSIIQDGLSPVPRFDVREWRIDDARTLAAVAVEPIAAPPCMTSDGAIFERVSGRTPPVTDPAVLAGLFARGNAARDRAAGLAANVAANLFRQPPVGEREQTVFAAAFAPVGLPSDFKQRVFRRGFVDDLNAVGVQRLRHGPYLRSQPGYSGTREYIEIRLSDLDGDTAIRVLVAGAVAIVRADRHNDARRMPHHVMLVPELERAWQAANDLLARLNTHGQVRLALAIGRNAPEGVTPWPTAEFTAWTTLEGPTNDELEAIKRDVIRESGDFAWEPEPEQGPANPG
jgi:hypothetical protein